MNDIRDWILAGRAAEEPLLRTRKRTRRAEPSRAAEEESFTEVSIRREAIRQANHRDADRHRLDKASAELIHDGRRQTVTLVNISGGGAMIEGARGLSLWDLLTIRLGDSGEIEAAVRWIRGNRLGLEFAQETRVESHCGDTVRMLADITSRSYPDLIPEPDDVAQESSDSLESHADRLSEGEATADAKCERKPRHGLIWSGQIHYDYDTITVRLRNISEGGALIECERVLPVGAELLLELDKAGSIFATVSWAQGDAAGLRFHRPFDLQRLAAARPAVAPARWVAPDHLRKSNGGASPWPGQRADSQAAAPTRPRRSIRR